MREETVSDIAIVGGGASAALTAWNLARTHGLRCTVVAPTDQPGLGLAYATPSLRNLLNVAACGMSADPDDPAHFLRWLQANVAPGAGPATFAPRAVYGLYLRHLHDLAAPRHVGGTVVGCRRDGGVFRLGLDDGRVVAARRVVLALGNMEPARLPGVDPAAEAGGRMHHDAWAPSLFGAIGADDAVALIGTGLTTVDVVLRLREHGHRGRITAISRTGAFPARHAPFAPAGSPVVDAAATAPTARAYLRAFRAALARGVEWRAAVDSLRPVVNALWAALPDAEKRRFRRHLQRRWDIHRHRMAPEIATVIDDERRAGTLRVVEGRVAAIAPGAAGLTLVCRGAGGERRIDAAHAINCTGPSLDYRRGGAPLLRRLLEQGDAVPGFGGAGFSCTPDGGVIGAGGAAVPGLFIIGPARLGVLFESIAIPEIARQAAALAATLAADATAAREAA